MGNRIQTDEHTVDRAGYKQVTPATRCDLASAATTAPQNVKIAIRRGPLRKRSVLLIRPDVGEAGTLYIGGDGATVTNGYPVTATTMLRLPLSPKVLVFGITSNLAGVDARTLESG